MTTKTSDRRVEREARLRWVPLAKMKVSPVAQRDLNESRVDHLVANMDLEQIGHPTVNERDGSYYIIDGQHRVEALKAIGYGDQQIQCWTYLGLTDEEMAERFLKLNDYLAVSAFDRFTKGVAAGRDVESDIDRLVRAQGLRVSRDKIDGAVAAVGTLRRIYTRAGSKTLGRTLRLARDAYGDPGLDAAVIDGLGHLCQRYNGELNDEAAVSKLAGVYGGVNGLLGKAEVLRRQTGAQRGPCVAAAAVEIINQGRGGKKLPSWWKS
jgi:hypothetical protein